MSNRTILGSIICYFRGHQWRRLTKKERDAPGFQVWASARDSTVAQMRRCSRCEAERIAKSRKPKETT